ncbi:MAG: undecaprenyldiphospho-muramoylpentapeptide beta-N-acetylglucosaminyltransferase [Candidatus Firestonebacteria bacterium]|nr:undecaprenyldiphospho-muramoylpentapeptide beta-N-acetylglucosaminyltransferase [Candidatus Firestonebacteria bacterium]
MKIMIAAGGTGGHIYPAIAFAREAAKKHETVFVGGKGGMEEKIVAAEGFRFLPIPAGKIIRRFTLQNIVNIANFIKGIFASGLAIRKEKPAVIIGFGGYVSAPVVIAGRFFRVPAALHEQNAIPGLTNKLLSKCASVVLASFTGTDNAFKGKVVFTGNPIREKLGSLTRAEARNLLKIQEGKKVVSIIGGSQGARSLNVIVYEALKKMQGDKLEVIWMTGEKDSLVYTAKLKEFGGLKVRISAFLSNMEEVYGATDVLIARAGATTVSEVLRCGVPAIFVPFPAAANNHQVYNARSVADKGAALMLEEKNLTGVILAAEIEKLLNNEESVKTIKENIKKTINKDSAKLMLTELEKLL